MDAAIEASQPAVASGAVDASTVQDAAHQEASLAAPPKEPLYFVSLRSVRSNPLDWTSFTTLLSEADKIGQISTIREAYAVFLARWPLCFGYVKRWAEHELRLGGPDGPRHAVAVYENALAAAPAVVELWIAYCNFLLSPASGVSPEQARHALHRATHACSLDPKAGSLWSQWAEFEYQTANAAASAAETTEGSSAAGSDVTPVLTSAGVQAAAAIYARGLACEASYVEMLWQKYRALAASAPAAADLLTPGDDADAAAVQQRAAAIAQARSGSSSAAEGAGSEASSSASGAASAEVTDADVRAAIMERREALYAASAAAAGLRRGYEAAVAKRTFFHVKPLDAAALAGWRDYLSFEERRGPANAARCEALYGRCLIACANYSEFWLRYAAFRRAYVVASAGAGAGAAASSAVAGAQSSSAIAVSLDDATAVGAAEAAVPVLQRAASVFLPRRIDIHLALAAHLEAAGRRAEALSVLQRLVDPSVAPAPSPSPSAAAEATAPGAGSAAGTDADTNPSAAGAASPAGPSGWAGDSAEVAVRFAHALARGGDVLAAVEALSGASRREAIRADAGAAAGVFAAYVRLSEALHGSRSPSSSSAGASVSSGGADAVRAVHEEAVAACPGELSVWLAYADFEASCCSQGNAGGAAKSDVAALRAVYRRALALPDAVAAASAAGAPAAGSVGSADGAAAADAASGSAAPALPTGRLNAESAAVALAAYVAAMDAHAGPSPSQVSAAIEAQEAAAAWDRARTSSGLDGMGALVGTAFAAARLREPPSTLHAGAAAAAAKAAAAAAAAQATAAANAAHAAELARLREQHAAELAAVSAANAFAVGRKRGAAEAGLASDSTDAAGLAGGAGAGAMDADGAAHAHQAKQARTGDVGSAGAGAGDGYSAAAAAAALSASHQHAAWQGWHAGQSAGAPAGDPAAAAAAGYGGYMPGPHGYPAAPGMAAPGYGAHPGYYGGAGGNMPPAQGAYGWGAGAAQGWGGY